MTQGQFSNYWGVGSESDLPNFYYDEQAAQTFQAKAAEQYDSLTAAEGWLRRRLSSELETQTENLPELVVEKEAPTEPRYRRYKRRLVTKAKDEKEDHFARHLLVGDDEPTVVCKSEDQIRKYLENKSIIVLASESFVDELSEEDGLNNRSVVSVLQPLIEKRLDFRYHKKLVAKIEETVIEIQDHIWRFAGFEPEAQEITIAKTKIIAEDMVTREYYDASLGEYRNTKESMLEISFELLSTSSNESITAYDILTCFGDLGGLRDFLLWILTPLIGYIIGDRFSYIVLRSLYMQNRTGQDGAQEFDDPNDEAANKVKQMKWLENTEPYRESAANQVMLNEWVQFLTCRTCNDNKYLKRYCCCPEKTIAERIFEKGNDRVERNLDVRNLIKAQETLKNLLHTVMPSKEKRKLMRIQRRSLVLEAGTDSSDSEDDFTAYKGFYKQFQKRFQFFDDKNYGDKQQLTLLKGVLDRDAMIGKKKNKKRKRRSRSVQSHYNSYQTDGISRADSTRQGLYDAGIGRSDSQIRHGNDVVLDIEMIDADQDHTDNGDGLKRSVSHGIVLRNSSMKKVTEK